MVDAPQLPTGKWDNVDYKTPPSFDKEGLFVTFRPESSPFWGTKAIARLTQIGIATRRSAPAHLIRNSPPTPDRPLLSAGINRRNSVIAARFIFKTEKLPAEAQFVPDDPRSRGPFEGRARGEQVS